MNESGHQMDGGRASDMRMERLLGDVHAQRLLLRAIVENVPVGICVLRGPDFVHEVVNPAYQALAPGRPILGRTMAELWSGFSPDAQSILERVLRTGEPHRAVDEIVHYRRAPDAPLEERCFSYDLVPLHVSEGQASRILVLVVETTERVHAGKMMDELAGVEQRRATELRSILDNMVDGVFVCDGEGRITLANEAGVRMLGRDSVGDVGHALQVLPGLLRVRDLDGTPVAPEQLPLVRALAGETVAQDDEIVYNPQAGRDVYIRSNAAPIRDDHGRIVGAVEVARDVTDLVELDRLKDQFISVAAHELKTPVAVMKGYAQALLRRGADLSLERRKMLDAIDRGADRIDRVVKDLLDISRLRLGYLKLARARTDLPDLVEDVADRMGLTTTRHRVRVVRSEPAVIRGDRDRLEQVLANMIDNAIKYSPGGGDVDVEVTVQSGEAVVSVADHGVGIPRESQARIFERFYRAHTGTAHDYGGMGVGLYISGEIISRHGGKMWFESEEGRGSTFYFSLPLRGVHGRG